MSIQKWEHFFKPEVRSAGYRYFSEGSVAISQPSDTEIQAYIRGSTTFKINLKSPSMASAVISASCICPALKKGQFCKHIWATLLSVEKNRSDFFDGKEEIELATHAPSSNENFESKKKSSFQSHKKFEPSESQLEKQAAYKTKQVEYRSQQYQKQKKILKDKKQALKNKGSIETSHPPEIETAMEYFSTNGFPLKFPLKPEELQLAKKKLSRVFHPDIGGSHNEIVELNTHFDLLMDYAQT